MCICRLKGLSPKLFNAVSLPSLEHPYIHTKPERKMEEDATSCMEFSKETSSLGEIPKRVMSPQTAFSIDSILAHKMIKVKNLSDNIDQTLVKYEQYSSPAKEDDDDQMNTESIRDDNIITRITNNNSMKYVDGYPIPTRHTLEKTWLLSCSCPTCLIPNRKDKREDLPTYRGLRGDTVYFPEYSRRFSLSEEKPVHKVISYHSTNDDPQNKRRRTIFTSSQLERLEYEFQQQQYIVGQERRYLARELGLNEVQVKVWFQNRRIKWRKLTHDYFTDENLMLVEKTHL